MNSTRYAIAGLLLLVGLGGGAWFFSKAIKPAPAALSTATVLPSPRPLPAFELVDERGEPFSPDDLRGAWHLVFFGFTHCPDICPATLQQLAVAVRRLDEQGKEPLPRILFVSVDPARDDAERLAAYTRNFGPAVRGVSGPEAELLKLTRPLGIAFAQGAASDSGYSVDHSTAVLVLNPEAEWHALFSTPHDIAAFVHDLPIIMAGR